MLSSMMRTLVPSNLQLLCKFDANAFKTIIVKRQPISFSVSKVLYARNKQAILKRKNMTMDKTETDGPVSTTTSIIAKRLYENRVETESISDNLNSFSSADDLRQRLENFTTQLNSKLSADNTTEISTGTLEQKKMDSRQDIKSNSIEQLLFKDDFLMQPKPATLLGTEDPNVPESQISCVGCGAKLQCHNRVFPGFMPSEKFKILSDKELKRSKCQRCYYIQHHDIFCAVSVSPDSYASMISKIQNVKSVIVMVVDVLDITGSIIPNLCDHIGQKHPIVIVGNKADLLAPDSPNYLVNARDELKRACYRAGYSNIRKVVFVSAKTGFGVERLISLLFSFYKLRVDLFLVGTANAGKSSLFNALLASDYCKHTARDLIERATVSVWPGTTLNFLKFPIMRPSSRTVSLRRKRLQQEDAIRKQMRKLNDQRKMVKEETWELKGEINKTNVSTDNQRKEEAKGEPWGQEIAGYRGGKTGDITLPQSLPEPSSFEEENFSDSYWMYDTPGVINPDQVMNLLEPNELSLVNPTNMIIPRCVLLKPGTTLFISGLSRIDFIKGDEALIATVHCSSSLPLQVVPTVKAEDFYKENVGTPLLGAPLGDKSRLDKIPALEMKEFNFVGEEDFLAVADVQLSSVGWVSVSPRAGSRTTLRAFTPGGKGICVRTPPLAPKYTHFRGKRIPRTPFFRTRAQGHVMIGKTLQREEN